MIYIVDISKCDGCGVCVDNCPTEVLEIQNNKVAIADADMCTNCDLCWAVCPIKGILERK